MLPLLMSLLHVRATLVYVASLFKQVLSDWFSYSPLYHQVLSSVFHSGSCNHLSSNSTCLSTKFGSSTPAIQVVDGCFMSISHIGHASTSTLFILNTFLIPNLTLIYVCHVWPWPQLHFYLWVSYAGSRETRQIIGTRRKVASYMIWHRFIFLPLIHYIT